MGKGIACKFKSKYGKVDELKDQNKKIGEVAYIQAENKHIFYMITKFMHFDKPTYETLEQCLINLKKLCLMFNIKSLAMPMIACGLDGLDWFLVSELINKCFLNSYIKIQIYQLPDDFENKNKANECTLLKSLYYRHVPCGARWDVDVHTEKSMLHMSNKNF